MLFKHATPVAAFAIRCTSTAEPRAVRRKTCAAMHHVTAVLGAVAVVLVLWKLMRMAIRTRYPVPAAGGVVVISGASTGIGRDAALALDRLGYHVIAGVRKTQDGESLAREASDRLTTVSLDVSTDTDVAAAVTAAVARAKQVGRPSVGAICNAGIAIPGPVELAPMEMYRQVMEVNFFGVLRMAKAFAPILRENRCGRLMFVSSVAGRVATPGMSLYDASKHAVEALADSMRAEMRPFGVHVCSIQPGPIATPIWGKGQEIGPVSWPEHPAYNTLRARFIQHIQRLVDMAEPAAVVTRDIVHALRAPYPQTRYFSGRAARVILTLRPYLSDDLLEWLQRRRR